MIVDGKKYDVYKIFDLTYNGSKVAYTIDDDWVNFFIGEDVFNTGLTIVKVTVNRTNTNIVTILCSHLQFLHGADTVIGIEYKNLCTLNILEAFKSSLACITRSCNKNNNLR